MNIWFPKTSWALIYIYSFILVTALSWSEPLWIWSLSREPWVSGGISPWWDSKPFTMGQSREGKIQISTKCSQSQCCLHTTMLEWFTQIALSHFIPLHSLVSKCLHATEKCTLYRVIIGQTSCYSAAIATTRTDSASLISLAVLDKLSLCFTGI